MSPDPANTEAPRKHRPYVPETMEMKEFTFRAVLIGLFLTALLGSANAYLGLKAGMTIAATYPAAVISMALLRLMNSFITVIIADGKIKTFLKEVQIWSYHITKKLRNEKNRHDTGALCRHTFSRKADAAAGRKDRHSSYIPQYCCHKII